MADKPQVFNKEVPKTPSEVQRSIVELRICTFESTGYNVLTIQNMEYEKRQLINNQPSFFMQKKISWNL